LPPGRARYLSDSDTKLIDYYSIKQEKFKKFFGCNKKAPRLGAWELEKEMGELK